MSQKTSLANQLGDLGDLPLQVAMWVSNYDMPLQLIMTVSFCGIQCLRINLRDSHVLVGFDATSMSTVFMTSLTVKPSENGIGGRQSLAVVFLKGMEESSWAEEDSSDPIRAAYDLDLLHI